jgi:hypothetical protein
VYVPPEREAPPHVSYPYICLCGAQFSGQLRLHVFSFQSYAPSETFQLRVIRRLLTAELIRARVPLQHDLGDHLAGECRELQHVNNEKPRGLYSSLGELQPRSSYAFHERQNEY